MSTAVTDGMDRQPSKRLGLFERYLSLWVGLCMVAGIAAGKWVPSAVSSLRSMEFGQDSHVNLPIAVLIWLMIVPMMMRVDFASIRRVGQRPRGLLVTLFVNWVVKPFSMAFLAWLFFRHVFSHWIPAADANQYIAGCIILAAAPCTAMVFLWSHLTDGDPAYTLVQVSLNDLIMLVLFAPIVRFLVAGASSLRVPFQVLLYSVTAFIVIPLVLGAALQTRSNMVRAAIASPLRPGHDRRPAGHARPDFRVSGGQYYDALPACPLDRGAHSGAGLFQFRIGLRPDAAA